jgi:Hypothetical protein (DUF2513)
MRSAGQTKMWVIESAVGRLHLNVPERSPKEMSYHVVLLAQAGPIDAEDVSTMGEDGFQWHPKCLTFQGHEFLDTIREKEIWRQTKEAAKQGGSQTLDFIWEIAKAIAKRELQKRTGLEF